MKFFSIVNVLDVKTHLAFSRILLLSVLSGAMFLLNTNQAKAQTQQGLLWGANAQLIGGYDGGGGPCGTYQVYVIVSADGGQTWETVHKFKYEYGPGCDESNSEGAGPLPILESTPIRGEQHTVSATLDSSVGDQQHTLSLKITRESDDQTVYDDLVTYVPPTTVKSAFAPSIQRAKREAEELKLYPVPVTDNLRLDWTGKSVTAEVYDLSGKKVQQIQLSEGMQVIDLSTLQSGAYVIRVGEITKRFIKE